MNNLLANEAKDVLARIQGSLNYDDPEKIQLVADLLFDTVALQARALAGEDVADKIKEVYASSLNLADKDRQVVVMHILNFAQGLATRVVTAALLGVASGGTNTAR